MPNEDDEEEDGDIEEEEEKNEWINTTDYVASEKGFNRIT